MWGCIVIQSRKYNGKWTRNIVIFCSFKLKISISFWVIYKGIQSFHYENDLLWMWNNCKFQFIVNKARCMHSTDVLSGSWTKESPIHLSEKKNANEGIQRIKYRVKIFSPICDRQRHKYHQENFAEKLWTNMYVQYML